MAEDLIMDAAQKFFKTVLLFAIALLLATAGSAQTTPVLNAPATVNLFGTSGQGVNVTSSGDPITFSIGAPSYASDDGNWLSVTSTSTTTPSFVTFALARAPFTEGVKQATVTLMPSSPSGVTARTITVTYTSGSGGGGGNTTLTAAPNPVFISTAANTTAAPLAVYISTSGANTETLNGISSSQSWLTAAISNATVTPSSSGSITLTASAVGLTSQTYSATVTVTTVAGGSLAINVSFSVGTGSGTGNWTVSPSSVSWNYTTGGNFPFPPLVTATPPSGSAVYNVAVNSGGSWLMVSDGTTDGFIYDNIPAGTGFYLKLGSQVNTLVQGNYTGQAVLRDSNNNQYTLTVSLTVNGGNASGLTVTPNPLTFNAALGSAQQSQAVTLISNAGGAVTVAGSGATPTWLSASGPSPVTVVANQSSSFTVFANPSGLLAGTYSGDIAVSIGGQSAILTVTLTVASSGGGGGTGTSAVAPTNLQFTYQSGTNPAFIARQSLAITGPPGAWSTTISSTATWLKVTPSSGSSLPDPDNPNSAPLVTIDPTGLALGSYAGAITVNAPGGSTNIQVSLVVVSGTILVPTPGSLNFSAHTGQSQPSPQQVFVSDSDNGLSTSSSPISAVANNDWITLSGLSSNGVTVNVDHTGKNTGVYSGSISISQTGAGNSPLVVPVVMIVNGGGSGGSGSGPLTFSQAAFSFTSVNGVVSPNSSNLTVSAASATTFSGTISYQPNNAGNWLTVSPLSGTTSANVSLSVNAQGLSVGTYNATISFNANGFVQTVGVTLTVSTNSGGNTGNINVSPTALTFSSQQGSNPATQSVSVSSASGTAGIPYTVQITSGSNWLSTSPSTGLSSPSTLTVTAAAASLQPGTYNGNIRLQPNGGGTVNIPVTLTVTAPPVVSASPTSLSFDYRLGDSAPAAKPIAVGGGGANLTFSATPSSTGNWLVVSPALGTTPGTVNVSLNTAALTATGQFTGTITVAGVGGATGSTTVTVTLNVTAPLPTITKVTNAASYAIGSISPGEIITLFATTQNPIGPSTPAGLTLDSTGKVATTLSGVQVLVNGYACPLIYVSATQVSAVVPYEVKLFTTASVQVKYLGQSSNGVPVNVATTQPGVFTANSSGSGPGAILNSNSTTNSPSNPATRGDVIVVYLTGEGETNPAGVTGKVTTVASPPAPLTPGPLLPVTVTIAGQGANWTFAGEAPGFVSGVMQLNVIVPTGVPAGDQLIQVSVGGNPSQSGVTVSLR
ncbi:MAG: hypothetical protein ABI759_26545 [Candidatus Solibacter sp.]